MKKLKMESSPQYPQEESPSAAKEMDIGDALIHALIQRGVKNVYGVPGDYVLALFDRLERCPDINLICTASEEAAGFAADAEARLSGLGVCLITYGVGAFKVCLEKAYRVDTALQQFSQS